MSAVSSAGSTARAYMKRGATLTTSCRTTKQAFDGKQNVSHSREVKHDGHSWSSLRTFVSFSQTLAVPRQDASISFCVSLVLLFSEVVWVCVYVWAGDIPLRRHRQREKLPVEETSIFVRVFTHNNVSEWRLPASKKSSEKLMSNDLHFWFSNESEWESLNSAQALQRLVLDSFYVFIFRLFMALLASP